MAEFYVADRSGKRAKRAWGVTPYVPTELATEMRPFFVQMSAANRKRRGGGKKTLTQRQVLAKLAGRKRKAKPRAKKPKAKVLRARNLKGMTAAELDRLALRLSKREAGEAAAAGKRLLRKPAQGSRQEIGAQWISAFQARQALAAAYPDYLRRLHAGMALRKRVAGPQASKAKQYRRLRKGTAAAKRPKPQHKTISADDDLVVLTREEFAYLQMRKKKY